ncbi:hypothetical protein B0I35DRAFT_437998 [Stachybotrys elegans]|uniref:Uncharacterized protein n=1 Tax=Stachybotrys elegans TaxID=80388 RepID=A0A8K0SIS3_9HYPO|nr:hypothetical protein B0I35DRAFT_437998 [Stachybotrys elegans]
MVFGPKWMTLLSFLALAGLFSQVEGYGGYDIPYNITVEVPTRLRIDEGIAPDSELRQRHNAYRVYLAAEPPGWGLGPMCWLVYAVRLDTQNITVTVPADVVPDGTRAHISTGLILRDNRDRVNGFSYTSSTTILGGNGTWSQRELDGWEIGSQDELSCRAFACARECEDTYNTGNDGSINRRADACVRKCARDLNPSNGAGSRHITDNAFISALFMAMTVVMFYS